MDTQNNLQLITTEKFGELECNFYRNINDDVLLTREQIGTALEYANPSKAIRKIHLLHKDRLEPLSIRIKLKGCPQIGANLTKQEVQECVYYTQRGVMEICRWSNKPKANLFMDWVWDIIEKYRKNELNPIQSMNTVNIRDFSKDLDIIKKNQEEILAKLNQSRKQEKSVWMKNTLFNIGQLLTLLEQANRINLLPDRFKPTKGDLSFSWTIHIVIKQSECINPIINFEEYYKCYKDINEYGKILDAIEYYPEIKELFTYTLDFLIDNFKVILKEERNSISL